VSGTGEVLSIVGTLRQRRPAGARGTGNNEWYTPEKYIELARNVLGGIDLDPASNAVAQSVVRARRSFTKEEDGLQQEWHGRVWLNPPYSRGLMSAFIDKLVSELTSGRTSAAILLTHAFTDTAWFHLAARHAQAIAFKKGASQVLWSEWRDSAARPGANVLLFRARISALQGNVLVDRFRSHAPPQAQEPGIMSDSLTSQPDEQTPLLPSMIVPRGGCEFIAGDPRALMARGIDPHCGAKRVPGSPYCAEHKARCAPRKEATDNVS
jgi:hypothetical protein